MYDALAEAAVEVVARHYYDTMRPQKRAELKAQFVQAFRQVLKSMQEKVGEEPGISY